MGFVFVVPYFQTNLSADELQPLFCFFLNYIGICWEEHRFTVYFTLRVFSRAQGFLTHSYIYINKQLLRMKRGTTKVIIQVAIGQ
jgi:hypothetical protein